MSCVATEGLSILDTKNTTQEKFSLEMISGKWKLANVIIANKKYTFNQLVTLGFLEHLDVELYKWSKFKFCQPTKKQSSIYFSDDLVTESNLFDIDGVSSGMLFEIEGNIIRRGKFTKWRHGSYYLEFINRTEDSLTLAFDLPPNTNCTATLNYKKVDK